MGFYFSRKSVWELLTSDNDRVFREPRSNIWIILPPWILKGFISETCSRGYFKCNFCLSIFRSATGVSPTVQNWPEGGLLIALGTAVSSFSFCSGQVARFTKAFASNYFYPDSFSFCILLLFKIIPTLQNRAKSKSNGPSKLFDHSPFTNVVVTTPEGERVNPFSPVVTVEKLMTDWAYL